MSRLVEWGCYRGGNWFRQSDRYADATTLQPETALDDLETTTHTTGTAILRRVLQAQWELLDSQLTDQYRQGFFPRRRSR